MTHYFIGENIDLRAGAVTIYTMGEGFQAIVLRSGRSFYLVGTGATRRDAYIDLLGKLGAV